MGSVSKEWWECYLSIAKKEETGGSGDDSGPIKDFVEFVDLFERYCPPDKYQVVLNIGAGGGAETRLLVDRDYSVMGITLGRDNIEMAKSLYGIDLVEMDMHYLDFEPGKFDAIFMVQTQEHALSSWIFALEMRFVLRDGGRIFTDLPSPNNREMIRSIWHTEVLYPEQIIWTMWKAGFKLIADHSEFDRYKYVFEKRPDGEFDMWGYVQYISKRRLALYLKDGVREYTWNTR